jgi:hypothetical protein
MVMYIQFEHFVACANVRVGFLVHCKTSIVLHEFSANFVKLYG